MVLQGRWCHKSVNCISDWSAYDQDSKELIETYQLSCNILRVMPYRAQHRIQKPTTRKSVCRWLWQSSWVQRSGWNTSSLPEVNIKVQEMFRLVVLFLNESIVHNVFPLCHNQALSSRQSGHSNGVVLRVSHDNGPWKDPLQDCWLLIMYGEVMSRVPMLLAAEPQNKILAPVWQGLVIITIVLQYYHAMISN